MTAAKKILHRDVILCVGATRNERGRGYTQLIEQLPAIFSILLPDGRPWLLAEAYLLSIRHKLTVRSADGGSLKVLASSLTQFATHCSSFDVDVLNVTESDMVDFARVLGGQRNLRLSPRRGANTIRQILDDVRSFLHWSSLWWGAGGEDVAPMKSECGRRSARPSYYPRRAAVNRKWPISTSARNTLWDEVSAQACESPHGCSNGLALDYMRSRRELILLLLEGTGCRPAELVRLRLSGMDGDIGSRRIRLPTLKRRLNSDPERCIPIPVEMAVPLEAFVFGPRARLMDALRASGKPLSDEDYLFVDVVRGAPLTVEALQKDFRRLAKQAAPDGRACMTMFRHRFITNMVRLHLMALAGTALDTERLLLSDSDYRAVLHKVKVFTGHQSERSLIHYVDWARDELGDVSKHRDVDKVLEELSMVALNLSSLLTSRKVECSNSAKQVMSRAILLIRSLEDELEKAPLRGGRLAEETKPSRSWK
ncbi:hypothetical protein PSO31014_02432 [Pandoraea soli]|uniref:Tyr recombinase domain-containing protein n=2 Tax=Pandoraea soli TaxID=2508293 RepID=A0ABY6VZN8_9BURK|nr:hypothetical protein PSO31014_02432 [Pandoraea soli]